MAQLSPGALFLDRDGVIIEDTGYLSDPAQVKLIAGSGAALAELCRAGIPLIIVSNQSGIGRGYYSEEQYERVHRSLLAQLAAHGAQLAAAYHCPDAPERAGPLRKPEPGMLQRAAHEHGLRLGDSVMIGDKLSDLEAGRRAGCATALVRTGAGRESESLLPTHELLCDQVFDSLLGATPWLLSRFKESARHA